MPKEYDDFKKDFDDFNDEERQTILDFIEFEKDTRRRLQKMSEDVYNDNNMMLLERQNTSVENHVSKKIEGPSK